MFPDDAIVVVEVIEMIDGLKLTMTGEDVRGLLDTRAKEHRRNAERWERQLEGRPADSTGEWVWVPEQVSENEAERARWRAEVLEFIREHLEPLEVYRLGPADLEFAELLPAKPDSVEQEEYEEAHRLGFAVERLARNPRRGLEVISITNPDAKPKS